MKMFNKSTFFLLLSFIISVHTSKKTKDALRLKPHIILPQTLNNFESKDIEPFDDLQIVTPTTGEIEKIMSSSSTGRLTPKIKIENFSHWREIKRFNISKNLEVVKYQSEKTGLTIVLSESDSPIVNGYFCLATETHDNDGLPHTLEHLIFLGSEEYPYKGVLDLLANRCLADRTNAWTDTDHTCYTIYTAGFSGFLQILPVYMDHILFPLLRKEDFLTEVHHVNGKGIDAGVVYNEMQGVENTASNLMYFSLANIIYPGESGYEVETGGYLRNLRNSTNIKKVRDYHEQFYRSENLVLTITGKFDEEEIFRSLQSVEEKILNKRQFRKAKPFVRPWQTKLENISRDQSNDVRVEFPATDETIGHIAVAWRLPLHISSDIPMMQAYSILLRYLTSSQVSPLEAEFVEQSSPLASSVSADILKVKEPSILVEFENVPVEDIDMIIPKMFLVLNNIVSAGPEKFDLERIHNIIDRKILQHKKNVENSPKLFVPDASVLSFLYGKTPHHLEEFVLSSTYSNNFRKKLKIIFIQIREKTNLFNCFDKIN